MSFYIFLPWSKSFRDGFIEKLFLLKYNDREGIFPAHGCISAKVKCENQM